MRFTSAQSRKHRGPGAQCGMQPCGRPYVCLRSEDVPTRTLLGPRGDGGGRCARLVAATIAARMWLVGSRAIRSRRDASGACVQYASRAVCRAQCGCERRACRRRGARLSPCNEWRGSVGVNEVHRARVPQHWGTGAQCGMQENLHSKGMEKESAVLRHRLASQRHRARIATLLKQLRACVDTPDHGCLNLEEGLEVAIAVLST